MIIWGFSFIWSKQVFLYYTPFEAILFRLLISALFMIGFGFWFKLIQPVSRKDIVTLVLLSFLEPFLYYIGEYFGLSQVSSTITAVVISTIPLFSPIAAYLFFREKVTVMNFIGIIVSIFGVLLVILRYDLTFSASWTGIAFLALSVLVAIFYGVIISKLSVRLNPYTIVAYQNGFGIIWFLPFFLTFDFVHFMSVGFVLEPFIYLTLLAIFASSLAYIFNTYGIQQLGIIRSSIFTNTIPVFTALFAYFFYGENMTLLNLSGIFLVVLGLFLSQTGRIFSKVRVPIIPEG